MTEKELKLRHCELDVRLQEVRVREAKRALDEGYKVLAANFEKEYGALKDAYDRAVLLLEREHAAAELAKTEADKGF